MPPNKVTNSNIELKNEMVNISESEIMDVSENMELPCHRAK
jgi:hypothetical protein